MQDLIAQKIQELEAELRKGVQILRQQEAAVKDTAVKLERIRGALAILNELKAPGPDPSGEENSQEEATRASVPVPIQKRKS